MNSPLNMRHPAGLALATLAMLAAAPAPAQTAASQTVHISASPVLDGHRLDAYGALSTEVGPEQLRDLNAVDLSAALRRTPGVQVSRFNPVGSFGGDEGGAVYVRGLGASRPGSEIKTYVDGLPFYMGVWNHALLDLLPVQGMQRISVHKGPQPQAFGNSFAAVDLSPRRGTQEGLQGDLRLAGGRFGTVIEHATLGGRFGPGEFSVAQGHAESDGHRPQADGRLDNGLLRGSVAVGEGWRMGALLLAADNSVHDPGVEGIPASRTGRYDTRGTLAGLSVEHTQERSRGRLQLYRSRGASLWDNPGANGVTRSTFELSGLRWREQVEAWSGGQIDLGLDVDRMRGSVAFGGFTAFDGTTLRLTSPHVGAAHTVALPDGWALQASGGLRLYRHDVFGRHSAPHAGAVLARGQTLALRANVARGLNFPGLDAALLNTIVPPLGGAPTSWRQLAPERMDHLELGLQWLPAAGSRVDLALFEDRLARRYVFAFPPAVSQPSFTNLGAYRIRGAEFSGQQRLSPTLSTFVGLSLLAPTLDDLPYAPRRAASAGLTWQQHTWRVSADAQTQAAMFTLNKARADGAANTARVGGFTVLNLRVAKALPLLGPRGEAFAAMENLADRRYAFRPGYPMPGRTVQVGLNLGL